MIISIALGIVLAVVILRVAPFFLRCLAVGIGFSAFFAVQMFKLVFRLLKFTALGLVRARYSLCIVVAFIISVVIVSLFYGAL